MDGQEYLNQISAAARPAKAPKTGISKIISSVYFKLGVGALAALIVIMIIGSAITGGRASLQDQSIALKLHIDRTMKVISDYQSSVKSSNLRSSSASLYSVLSNTDTNLTTFLTNTYNYKESSVDKDVIAEADLEQEALYNDLFEAKINGTLDRIYAHKMAYEISMISAKEVTIINGTKDEGLKAALMSSYNSLNNLYEQFSDFSVTK